MDNTRRFSDRVEDYIRYRPHYPPSLVAELQNAFGFKPEDVVADIGAGSGISSLPFLEYGNLLFAVEPNEEMRSAAERLHARFTNHTSIAGTAEATTLPAGTIDVVFCGQAFHWFDPIRAKAEFNRILKPGGHIVLAWNERKADAPFARAYNELLLAYLPEYAMSKHRSISTEVLGQFFAPRSLQIIRLSNFQHFDLAGLKGRLKSASYFPASGELTGFIMRKMEVLFQQYADNGQIRFDYDTKIYWC